jgi:hypothetical protein
MSATLTLDSGIAVNDIAVVLIFRSPKHGCPHLIEEEPQPTKITHMGLFGGEGYTRHFRVEAMAANFLI